MDMQVEGINNTSMVNRVFLLEYKGALHVAYLPDKVVGRYTFLDYDDKETLLPVWVLAHEGQWMLQCGNDCVLYQGDVQLGKLCPIEKGTFVSLLYKGTAYNIYADWNDNMFYHYKAMPGAQITIGRDSGNALVYSRTPVSRLHATITYIDEQWHLTDENSINGVYLNGRYSSDAHVKPGDVVFIMGLLVILGAGYIAINNSNGRVVINTNDIMPTEHRGSSNYLEDKTGISGNDAFSRQPRRQFKIEPNSISVSLPPVKMSGNKTPLYLRMASPALMGGRAIAGGNALMAVSSMALPMLTQGYSERDRKEYEDRRCEKYYFGH